MLPPQRRLGHVLRLIDEGKFSTLTAGRQTGKTTSVMSIAGHLNAAGRFRAIWFDVETATGQPDPTIALRTILNNFDRALSWQQKALPRPNRDDIEQLLQDPS